MTKREFKEQFVVIFCGTWVAQHYDDYCARGQHEALERPPMEDAMYLAEAAWTEYLKLEAGV